MAEQNLNPNLSQNSVFPLPGPFGTRLEETCLDQSLIPPLKIPILSLRSTSFKYLHYLRKRLLERSYTV